MKEHRIRHAYKVVDAILSSLEVYGLATEPLVTRNGAEEEKVLAKCKGFNKRFIVGVLYALHLAGCLNLCAYANRKVYDVSPTQKKKLLRILKRKNERFQWF